jgi:hypothetical protein
MMTWLLMSCSTSLRQAADARRRLAKERVQRVGSEVTQRVRLYARAANDVRQQLQIRIRHNEFRAASAVRAARAGAYAGPMHLGGLRALQALLHDRAAALCSHDVGAEAIGRGRHRGSHDGALPGRRHAGA